MRVAYQGLAGAYSEAAAAALFPQAEHVARRTFGDVFASLARDADAAVVPIENTHAGTVADVYELLRENDGVQVIAEAIVKVRHCLLGAPGGSIDAIRTARSHPQALAQTDAFLRAHGIEPVASYDTAGAAAEIAALADPTVGAVASRRAARRYGLDVLAASIETSADNFTRFFAVTREPAVADAIPAARRDGAPKTSLAYATANVPGALTRSLQPFATAGLQLTKIESRPSRVAAWEYVFYLDFEGDPAVSPAAEALALMRTCCAWVRTLGTYPAASEVLDPDAEPA